MDEFELEEGEIPCSRVNKEHSDGSEEDQDESSGEETNCVSTSLFDALAAAQEANEKYRLMNNPHSLVIPRADHRLPDDFLIRSYSCAIKQTGLSTASTKTDNALIVMGVQSGCSCEALWPGDNHWYPAKVVRVKEWKNAVVVRYVGFPKEEEEEVLVKDIRSIVRRKKRSKIKRRSRKKKKKLNPDLNIDPLLKAISDTKSDSTLS